MIYFEKGEQKTNQYIFCLHYTLMVWEIYELLICKIKSCRMYAIKLKQNLETLKVILKNEKEKKEKF